jgi:hypothetical protein
MMLKTVQCCGKNDQNRGLAGRSAKKMCNDGLSADKRTVRSGKPFEIERHPNSMTPKQAMKTSPPLR